MAKVVHCNELGFNCGFIAKADTEEDLLGQVAAHANEMHGISKVTAELVEQVKGVIREE